MKILAGKKTAISKIVKKKHQWEPTWLPEVLERKMSDQEAADYAFKDALKRSWRTEPADREIATQAVRELQVVINEPEISKLKIEWAMHPDYSPNISFYLSAECDRSWATFYAASELVGVHNAEAKVIYDAVMRTLDNVHLVLFHTDKIVCVEYPDIYKVDEQGRPHAVGTPDLRYRGEPGKRVGTHAWHGIRMPKRPMEHPESITLADIQSETNQERLRALIALWPGGEVRYLHESGAKPIDKSEFGELYHLANNSLVLMCDDGVEQLDGSRPRYLLRPNAECRPMKKGPNGITYGEPQKLTARNAAASTYGLRGEEYQVEFRS